MLLEAHDLLNKLWEDVSSDAFISDLPEFSLQWRSVIVDIITSNTKTYHYVPLTQLLAKAVNPELDCRSIQKADDADPKRFDARTIAHQIVVPFDKANHNVLGGSNEPYVNNPLRVSDFSLSYLNSQKNKKDWKKIVDLLDFAEETGGNVAVELLKITLHEIHLLLNDVIIVYPIPRRVSNLQLIELLAKFNSYSSGGNHLETIVKCTLETLGDSFQLFDEVRRSSINTADASSGMSGDIECYKQGDPVLAVEVKDRSLDFSYFESSISKVVEAKFFELIIFANVETNIKKIVDAKIERSFSNGLNIYILDFNSFAYNVIPMLGEHRRIQILSKIGIELDRVKSSLQSRRLWRDLLVSL